MGGAEAPEGAAHATPASARQAPNLTYLPRKTLKAATRDH
jgi:hypothetical protein